MRFLIGVDEAGRGPLAGPVAIGVGMAPANFDIKKVFPGVADSKVLSPEKREEIFALLKRSVVAREVRFCVRYSSASSIDRLGITRAVVGATARGVRTLAPEPTGVRVVLDGLLHAPQEYEQETIIRGDASEPIISLASIAAKVSRDRLMMHFAKKFPGYYFEAHKGYGTRAHYAAIEKHGLSAIHRKTYCKNIFEVV